MKNFELYTAFYKKKRECSTIVVARNFLEAKKIIERKHRGAHVTLIDVLPPNAVSLLVPESQYLM